MKAIRVFQASVVVLVGAATGFGVCAGCNAVGERVTERAVATARARVEAPVAQKVAVPVPLIVSASAIAATPSVGAVAKPVVKAASIRAPQSSALRVKRLVVTTGVKDREPLGSGEALSSDGAPIYAFAELGNEGGESENVRITFERKGGTEKVGDVSLPVPGNVSRHRTWAFTRFIRSAGVWEAVLWSESGTELGRTVFEVG